MSRIVALLVVVAVVTGFAQAPPVSAPGGVIRGKVTAADTGEPIANAEIQLTAGTFMDLTPKWSALAGADGRYEIAGLPAGRYRIAASRLGYVRLEHGQRGPGERGIDIVVSTAAVTERIDFSLPRGAVIVARVIDEFGDPAPGYELRVLQRRAGSPALVNVSSGSLDVRTTDDRGETRVWGLSPGEYYVAANAGSALAVNPARRTQAQTFFPGTTEADARPVVVGLGEEVFIEFPLATARASRISGAIVGAAQFSSPPTASLARRSAGVMPISHPISVLPDGRFTATGLVPAEYVITARAGTQAALLTFRVSGEDIEGLTLTMKDPVTLRGRVLFEPKPPARSQWPATMRISPVFTEGIALSSQRVLNEDWSFETSGVMGNGVLRFSEPLPSGWFLKTVTVDGREVTDVPVDFATLDGRPIAILLTDRLSQLSGIVLDSDKARRSEFSVIVFPEDSALWTLNSRAIVVARPDQNGRFVINGLPAGRYLIRAVESILSGAQRNPEMLNRLRAGATSLRLKDRETAEVTLRLMP